MDRRRRNSIDREFSSLTAQLKILNRREAEYQKLLENLQALKDTVSREKDILEAKAKDLDDQRKPVNWLPNEILGQIFLTFTDLQLGCGTEDPDSPVMEPHPPIIVSHVCHRWREVALSNPHIWSRIHFRSRWNLVRARAFIARSGIVPMDIYYHSSPEASTAEESRRARVLLSDLENHLHRIRFLEFHSKVPDSVARVTRLLNNPACEFKQLRSLSLSIIGHQPILPLGSLLENNLLQDQQYQIPRTVVPPWSHLTHLKFEEIPIFNIPYHLIANLVSLELVYPPRKVTATRRRYYLRMSALLHFFSLSNLLEELTLSNTVPIFDVALPDDNIADITSQLPLVPVTPVKLDRLKVINWSFPCSDEVHRFMTFIDAPALERLDIWVENQFVPLKDQPSWNWHRSEPAVGFNLTIPSALVFPSLRFLSLQCPADDATIAIMRKFAFPVLESFELTNIDKDVRDNKGKDKSLPLPSLPRLESVFRDPRLFHLTHFTLSHFKFSSEHGRAEAVLGYMPVLTSLSFDACAGVGKLLGVLESQVIGPFDPSAANGTTRRRRGVKVCPRLETLSFWNCDDLEFVSLRAIVLARNGDDNGDGGNSPTAEKHPNGAGLTVTRAERDGKVIEKTEHAVVVGRKIKPLRKPARRIGAAHVAGSALDAIGGPAPSTSIVSSMITAKEAFKPAPIVFIRIQDCSSIRQVDAGWLREHGVSDVIWRGHN